MKVILTTNIKKIGKIGDLVNVKDGYARNFLFPKKMALRENKKNIEYYKNIEEEIKNKENEKLEEAINKVNKIKKLKISFSREADEKDQLYGSISKKEIINFLRDKSIKINFDDIIISQPIRTLGNHQISINPYVDIRESITIYVIKN